MSTIPRFSLTDLTRSAAALQTAVAAHHLALLTRHGKPALAVLPVDLACDLLRVADQAAGLVQRPNLLQASAVLQATQHSGLISAAPWLRSYLQELAREQA
jgi:hypothetical protein